MSFAVPKRCELEAEVLGRQTKGFSQARVKSPKTMRASMRQEEVEEEIVTGEIVDHPSTSGTQHIVDQEVDPAQDSMEFEDTDAVVEEEVKETVEENGNAEKEEPVAGRKRGRPRTASEAAKPTAANTRATKSSAAPALPPPESPARKSSRVTR